MSEQVASKTPADNSAQFTSPSTNKPVQLGLATLLVALFWLSGMLWLVLTTANPITLNQAQIKGADVIVQGVIDLKTRECSVVQSWPALDDEQKIQLTNIPAAGIKAEQSYLIPLTRENSAIGETRWLITPTPDEQTLIYPATEESLKQLEVILNST